MSPLRAHEAEVDAALRQAVARGATTLAEALGDCAPADPILARDRVVALRLPLRWARPSQTPGDPGHDHAGDPRGDARQRGACRWNPELHALDCEWYFDAATVDALVQRYAGPSRSVLCLGTPTVAVAAAAGGAHVTLVERDPVRLRRRFGPRLDPVTLAAADLGREVPELRALAADVALLDPPWYEPHPSRWLAIAARHVRLGGSVVLVVPPILHRPGMEAQRARWRALARACGEVQDGPPVRYETPAFERRALAAAGLQLPDVWRRADTLCLTVRRRSTGALPEPAPPDPFRTFVLGPRVVKLAREPRAGTPRIEAPPGGFVWDRVSTRDPRYAAIGLWTSHGRVALTRGNEGLEAVLSAMQAGREASLAVREALPGLPAPDRAALERGLRALEL